MVQKIEVIRADITTLKVDAIVNAANNTLLGGGGVDGAIHRRAGSGLLDECRTLGGCKTGEAKITGGYNLPAAYVIHTVGPVYAGRPTDPEKLASCYYNSLEVAAGKGLRTVAFSAISCGVYGYPIAEASRIAVRTVNEWFRDHPDYDIEVYLVGFNDEVINALKSALDTENTGLTSAMIV